MTDPISARVTPLDWSDAIHESHTVLAPNKDEVENASKVISATYYQSSIQSLAVVQEAPQKSNSVELNSEKKSVFRRAYNWFKGLVGLGSKEETTVAETAKNSSVEKQASPTTGVPKLKTPEHDSEKKLAEALRELNDELIKRQKDSAEFEAEMNRIGGSKDACLFINIIKLHQEQENIKQTSIRLDHDDMMIRHKKNKELHTLYHELRQEIAGKAKVNKVLKWINVGSSVGIVGSVALAFATGGASAIWSFALPLFSLSKGALTIAQGTLKSKTDKDTGELSLVNHETEKNSGRMDIHLETMQLHGDEIKVLLDEIRRHLDAQAETTKLFTQQMK